MAVAVEVAIKFSIIINILISNDGKGLAREVEVGIEAEISIAVIGSAVHVVG